LNRVESEASSPSRRASDSLRVETRALSITDGRESKLR
jgi:hypothetical protein